MTKEEKEFTLKVERNLDNFTLIFENGQEVNPIPDNEHLIVYFSNGSDKEGWIEIHSTLDLGLEAFIAKSWIKFNNLK